MYRLPFWGKVIEEGTAATIPKDRLGCLGNNGGKGPRLFIDGQAYVNLKRSDCCISWMIPTLPETNGGKRKREVLELVPTHMIKFEPFHIILGNGEKYSYEAPVLVDNPDHADVMANPNGSLYRLRTPLDSEELTKAPKQAAKRRSSFATR